MNSGSVCFIVKPVITFTVAGLHEVKKNKSVISFRNPVRLETAPTGPGANRNYRINKLIFIKPRLQSY